LHPAITYTRILKSVLTLTIVFFANRNRFGAISSYATKPFTAAYCRAVPTLRNAGGFGVAGSVAASMLAGFHRKISIF